MIEPQRRYTEKEAAELLGVSRTTIYTLRKDGELRFMPFLKRSVRYKGSHLLEYLGKCERHAIQRAPGAA